MKQKKIFNLFALTAFIFTFSIYLPAQTNANKTNTLTADGEYSIVQSIKLQKNFSGIDGKIEVLRDARITGDVFIRQAKGFTPDVPDNDAKLKEMFEKAPIRPIVLRVVAANGKIIDSKALECISAEFKAVRLYANAKQSYQITCDYDNFAPYDGDEDSFFEVSKGKIQRLEAFDSKTGEKVEMAFVDSHRVGWKIAHVGAGKNRDILSVFTGWKTNEANENESGFVVSYQRFHFDGKRWVRYERKVEEDYWEDEFDFPENAKFPKSR